jgi:hypothetical protein
MAFCPIPRWNAAQCAWKPQAAPRIGGVEDGPAQWRRAIADALDLGGGE